MLSVIPRGTVVTPHPKEFERLFGISANDFDRCFKAIEKAKEYGIYIVLKGHHTLVATPSGKGYFNNTGNSGMGKAGSGDVLTGIITGFLAQDYTPEEACILGVYLHGIAGDHAARKLTMEAMVARDITRNLSEAFESIS